MLCGATCTDVTSDRANCGFCGNVCGDTEACSDATCVPTGAGRLACGSPGSIPASGGSVAVDLTTGSGDGPLSCGTASPGSDRAYMWTPSASGTFTITSMGTTSAGSDYDTVLAVFSSATCDSTSELTCNDDSTGLASSVSLSVTAGTRYYIVVESYVSPTPAGTVTLTVTSTGAP